MLGHYRIRSAPGVTPITRPPVVQRVRDHPGTHRVEQLYLLCQKTRPARLVGSQNYPCWSALVVGYTGLSSYKNELISPYVHLIGSCIFNVFGGSTV